MFLLIYALLCKEKEKENEKEKARSRQKKIKLTYKEKQEYDLLEKEIRESFTLYKREEHTNRTYLSGIRIEICESLREDEIFYGFKREEFYGYCSTFRNKEDGRKIK